MGLEGSSSLPPLPFPPSPFPSPTWLTTASYSWSPLSPSDLSLENTSSVDLSRFGSRRIRRSLRGEGGGDHRRPLLAQPCPSFQAVPGIIIIICAAAPCPAHVIPLVPNPPGHL